MDFDNLYPTNGEYFGIPNEPAEQALDRKEERAKVKRDMKLAETLIARWNERITFYDSVSAIATDVRSDPAKFFQAWEINRGMKQLCETEKEWLEDLISTFKR